MSTRHSRRLAELCQLALDGGDEVRGDAIDVLTGGGDGALRPVHDVVDDRDRITPGESPSGCLVRNPIGCYAIRPLNVVDVEREAVVSVVQRAEEVVERRQRKCTRGMVEQREVVGSRSPHSDA